VNRTADNHDPAPAPQTANLPRYKQVAAMIADQVADGVLAPGALAPSDAALAKVTGYSVLTCRRALRTLIKDGILIQGSGPSARPRVPGPGGSHQMLTDARRALSSALAEHRRAAGLTQPQLAELIGVSVTRVGHAETGRLWQSRPFWEGADKVLNADGGLLRLHDAYRAAELPRPAANLKDTTPATEETPPEPVPADALDAITIDVPEPVKSITITWLNGTVTTVCPPTGRRPQTHEGSTSQR
jgi:DNA-binding XRE family transcriptional regulator